MAPEGSAGIVVPVGKSVTLRNTVGYAVEEATNAAERTDGESVALHFVYPAGWRSLDPATDARAEHASELLDRVSMWVAEDLGIDNDGSETPEESGVALETALIGTEEYLFSPGDFARVLGAYAREHGLGRVILDPEYEPAGNAPMLRPLGFELERTELTIEEAPVERPARREALLGRGSVVQFVTVFGLAYVFYLALGGFAVTDGFELATGAVSAAIVAGLLWRVAVRRPFAPTEAAKRVVRLFVYIPYLLWEIAKANVSIAYVVLHPRLPIDPRMVRFEAAIWGDIPVTTLANSITLTPGTLTVDVTDREFHVHALTADSRTDLLAGALERAVRFVFYGRSAMAIASPAERDGPAHDDPNTENEKHTDNGEGSR